MNIKKLAILALFIAAAIYYLLPSDEKEIRGNMESLAQYCSSSLDDTPIATLKEVMLAQKLCSFPCRVQVESFELNHDFSKKDFSDRLLMLRRMTVGTQFSFRDTTVTFPMDET